MTTPPMPRSQTVTKAAPSEGFEALIAYEDLASGLAARQCIERLSRDLDTHVHVTLWRLDMLKERELARSAVHDAAAADVVLLSLRGEHPLSSGVKEWLGAWLEQHDDRDGALGVLLEWERRQTQSAYETLAFLHSATLRHPVDLIAGYFQASTIDPHSVSKDNLRPTETTTHGYEGSSGRFETPPSHWGINE